MKLNSCDVLVAVISVNNASFSTLALSGDNISKLSNKNFNLRLSLQYLESACKVIQTSTNKLSMGPVVLDVAQNFEKIQI